MSTKGTPVVFRDCVFREFNEQYVVPNEKTYNSWYTDFSGVCQITAIELGAIPLAGNVTIKPGSAMVKIQSDPNVYAISRYGKLRKVTTEQLAAQLYGTNWNQFVIDIPDVFFVNYTWNEPNSDITSLDQYSVVNELANSTIECATAGGPGC